MRTTAEVTVHNTAGMQEGHPLSNIQSGLQNRVHAGGRLGGRRRPEHALVNGHLRDMSQFLRAGMHLHRPRRILLSLFVGIAHRNMASGMVKS